jgi:hypothetical protein
VPWRKQRAAAERRALTVLAVSVVIAALTIAMLLFA